MKDETKFFAIKTQLKGSVGLRLAWDNRWEPGGKSVTYNVASTSFVDPLRRGKPRVLRCDNANSVTSSH